MRAKAIIDVVLPRPAELEESAWLAGVDLDRERPDAWCRRTDVQGPDECCRTDVLIGAWSSGRYLNRFYHSWIGLQLRDALNAETGPRALRVELHGSGAKHRPIASQCSRANLG